MDKQILKYIILYLAMLGIVIGFVIYTYNFYQNCNGAVVRGAIGWACVAGGSNG